MLFIGQEEIDAVGQVIDSGKLFRYDPKWTAPEVDALIERIQTARKNVLENQS